MTFPRWLRPWHPGSGLLFGYVFGYVAWIALLISFMIKRGQVSDEDRLLSRAAYGLLWAIPWAVLWGMSGALALEPHRYPATLVTALGIASGTTYSLLDGSFGGWQTVTIPLISIAHVFLYHFVALPIWIVVWEILDWWSEPPAQTPG